MPNSNHRALIVEDEVMLRNLTIRALSREGFQCDSAADGEEAILLTKATNYEVVVTDLKMPNMNGHELSVTLLNNTQHRPLILVLTGVAEPRLAKDLLARGVEEIIYKPVDYPTLAKKIRDLTDCSVNSKKSVAEACPEYPVADETTVKTTAESPNGPPTIGTTQIQRISPRLDDVLPMSVELLNVYKKSNSI